MTVRMNMIAPLDQEEVKGAPGVREEVASPLSDGEATLLRAVVTRAGSDRRLATTCENAVTGCRGADRAAPPAHVASR